MSARTLAAVVTGLCLISLSDNAARWIADHVLNFLWLTPAGLFIGWLAGHIVRAAKARGQRLFVDLPNQRLNGLVPDRSGTHHLDAL